MFAAASEYILLSLNFFEIIVNLLYLGLYFANISFGVVLNSSNQSSSNYNNNSNSNNYNNLNSNNNSNNDNQTNSNTNYNSQLSSDYHKDDDDYLKYHNKSSAWLTIIDSKPDPNLAHTLPNHGKNGNAKKSAKFANDLGDTGTTVAIKGNKATGGNSDPSAKKAFYKTLPKAFGKREEKSKSNVMFVNGGSLGGSRESLRSGQNTGISSSSSSSSSSSLHNIAPNRPPPPPPSNRRHSGVNAINNAMPATMTSHLATSVGGAPSREQMFISLLTSVLGFFAAKFHLTWLLLFYSLYIMTGLVQWLYNHAFIYRRVKHLNYPDQLDYNRRSLASRASSVFVSAPSQSLGISSALDLTKVCENIYDEIHLQMLASRRDVVDIGLKCILIMSAYDLSSSL